MGCMLPLNRSEIPEEEGGEFFNVVTDSPARVGISKEKCCCPDREDCGDRLGHIVGRLVRAVRPFLNEYSQSKLTPSAVKEMFAKLYPAEADEILAELEQLRWRLSDSRRCLNCGCEISFFTLLLESILKRY